jgi:hypothetical protein
MSMDFETVRFLRFAFAVIFAIVGGAAGIKYGGILPGQIGAIVAPAIGAVVGAIFGWNLVDLFKGRAHK